MKTLIYWLTLCLIFGVSGGCQTNEYSNAGCSPASQKFLNSPTGENWTKLVLSHDGAKADDYATLANLIAEYDEARGQRDLPNSMTRESPDALKKHLDAQNRVMQAALARIQKIERAKTEKMISSLAKQSYNQDLIWSSAEIAYRISPGLEHRLELELDGSSNNCRILKSVHERFAAGHGKIGDW